MCSTSGQIEAQAGKEPAPTSHLQTHKSSVDFVGSRINFYHEGFDSNLVGWVFLVIFLIRSIRLAL